MVVVIEPRGRGKQPFPCSCAPQVSLLHSISPMAVTASMLYLIASIVCSTQGNLRLEHMSTNRRSCIGSGAPLPALSDKMLPLSVLLLGKPLPWEPIPGQLHCLRHSNRQGVGAERGGRSQGQGLQGARRRPTRGFCRRLSWLVTPKTLVAVGRRAGGRLSSNTASASSLPWGSLHKSLSCSGSASAPNKIRKKALCLLYK